MTEQRGKAGRALEHLYESAATRAPTQGPERPKLRLRPDAPAIEVDETTPIVDALTQLDTEHIGTLALRAPSGEPRAVVLSVERYLDLALRELEDAPGVMVQGHAMLTDADLKTSHVEQVDPTEPWKQQPTGYA